MTTNEGGGAAGAGAAGPIDPALIQRLMDSMDIKDHLGRMTNIQRGHMLRVMRATAARTAAEIGVAVNLPDEAVQRIIRDGGTRVGLQDLELQAREALQETLAKGRELGLGGDDLAELIQKQVPAGRFKGAGSEYRSLLIARTETAFAQNLSSVESYRAAGYTHLQAVDNQVGYDDPDCFERNGNGLSRSDEAAERLRDHPNGTLMWIYRWS